LWEWRVSANWSSVTLELIKLKFGTVIGHGKCYIMDNELPPKGAFSWTPELFLNSGTSNFGMGED